MSLAHLKPLATQFGQISHKIRNTLIADIADSLGKYAEEILIENQKDLNQMSLNDPLYDRVALNEERISGMIQSCQELIDIDDPLDGKYSAALSTHYDLHLRSIPVPLGVVACIYEARPNVTLDLAILCIKSGNVCLLKWGSQATHTNAYLRGLIQDVLEKHGINPDVVSGYSEDRDDMMTLLQAVDDIDVIIPRGGKWLIQFVRDNARVPVIETGAGVVHIYLDNEVDEAHFEKITNIIVNAKISRPSVCNALDTLIIHENVAQKLIEAICMQLTSYDVVIGVLLEERHFLPTQFQYQDMNMSDFSQEYLSLQCGIKFVSSLEEAIQHIAAYSSHHSDVILTDNGDHAKKFLAEVDSAVVYHNTSPRFSDGGCFWFGGEVGISTQKLHARGPMGCRALTTYKYIVDSDFLTR